MVKLINLTPHEVTILGEKLEQKIPASGVIARVSSTSVQVDKVEQAEWFVPLVVTTYGAVTGLHEATEDTIYIVSAMVRAAVPHRLDVVSPAEFVRDDQGKIIGCGAFERNARFV